MKSTLTLIIAIFSLSIFVHGQTKISGKIIDENKEPLIGASLFIKGTTIGTVTDIDGEFILSSETPTPWVLEASYIGYEPKTLNLSSGIEDIEIILSNDPYQLNEVVVSANKRLESAQSVPMSISTLTPVALKRAGRQNFRDFASGIPNLSFGPSGGGDSGRADNTISIRGIEGKGTTAFYLDETPLPENIDIRLIDVARVEVLKGPQGTLYGARNMGGAVKVITNQPGLQHMEGSTSTYLAKVKEGDFDYGFQGTLNLPIGEKLALRIAGYYDFESGIFDRQINRDANILNAQPNITTFLSDASPFEIATDACPNCNLENKENVDDERNYGFHASLGFYPTENISIIPKVIMQKQSGDGYDFSEGFPGNFTQTRTAGIPEFFKDEWVFYSLTAKVDFKSGALISNTSFLDRATKEQEDATGYNSVVLLGYSPEDPTLNDVWGSLITNDRDIEQFTQELRFQSNFKGAFDFTAGLFYTFEEKRALWNTPNGGINPYMAINAFFDEESAAAVSDPNYPFYFFDGLYKSRELAFFGEANFTITSRLKASVGLRYFNAKNSIDSYEDGYFTGERNEVIGEQPENGLNPKFNLSYQADKDQLLYASIARGFRLGGVNEVLSMFFCSSELPTNENGTPTYPRFFDSDYLWNYEVGYKGKWADGKLLTNAAIFYNDWQNLQLSRGLECGYGYIDNVGTARTIGMEFEFKAKPRRELEIGGGFGLLDAKITDGGAFSYLVDSGDRILFTPNWTANANIQYTIALEEAAFLYLRSDLQYVGERVNTFNPESKEDAYLVFAPYTLLNARLGVEFANFEISLFGQNLTNTVANFGTPRAFNGEVPGRPRYALSRPLTVGLQLGAYF